jgi:hypothetical protein
LILGEFARGAKKEFQCADLAAKGQGHGKLGTTADIKRNAQELKRGFEEIFLIRLVLRQKRG